MCEDEKMNVGFTQIVFIHSDDFTESRVGGVQRQNTCRGEGPKVKTK